MISPKVIDVEGNRIETDDKISKNYCGGNLFNTIKVLDWKIYNSNKTGRFPTQLFTNINEDKYKYIKIIKND